MLYSINANFASGITFGGRSVLCLNGVTESEKQRNLGAFERVEHAAIPEEEPIKVWIKDLEFPVLLLNKSLETKMEQAGNDIL